MSIAEEAAACRAAWADHPYDPADPPLAWHLHDNRLAEFLTEPAESRISFILSTKPEDELALRLRLFRPIRGPTSEKARAAYEKARATYMKARAAYEKRWAAYREARVAYEEARVAYEEAWTAADEARDVAEAWAAYREAWAAYREAWAAYEKARATYMKARAAYEEALLPLHATECRDCPWDGRTIFPASVVRP